VNGQPIGHYFNSDAAAVKTMFSLVAEVRFSDSLSALLRVAGWPPTTAADDD
jgi:hypothetical protein